MLNRFRDFVKRLELPQEGDIVYRIIDDELNAVEVTMAQYSAWRLQNDVTKRAIVGQDTVENVMVRTTFSIMPEHRGYKPFGTSAYQVYSIDPLTQYSKRYDTWREAEQGHWSILEHIRRESATAREADRRAENLAGTAGAVRLAVSAGLTALFHVNVHSDDEAAVQTPLSRPDGSFVSVTVYVEGGGFRLSGSIDSNAPRLDDLCKTLGVVAENGEVTCEVEDEAQLPQGIMGVAQVVACISAITEGNG